MAISIYLELEIQSCKGIYALRHQYGSHAMFVVSPLRHLVYNEENLDFSTQQLPKLAAAHAPFEIELYKLHRGTRTSKISVKYSLQSTSLWDLRRDIYAR
jgi:hypothetical protein